jgi:hypothetical protein
MAREVIQPPSEPITEVLFMTVSPSGTVYLSDFRGRGVAWMYSSEGKLLGRLGRAGKGPGEFESLEIVGFRGDTVFASDAMLDRLTYFDRKGNVIGTVTPILTKSPIPPTTTAAHLREGTLVIRKIMADGSVFVFDTRSAPVPALGPMSAAPTAWVHLRIARSELGKKDPAQILDTLAVVNVNKPFKGIVKIGGMPSRIQQPWDDSDLAEASSNGAIYAYVQRTVAAGEKPSYTMLIRSPARVLGKGSIAYAPVSITDEDVETLRTQFISNLSSAQKAAAGEGAIKNAFDESLYRPAHKPAVSALLVGNDSTVWVRRQPSSQTVTWELYNTSGQLIATAEVPASFKAFAVNGRALWGSEVVDDEVVLVKYAAK